MTLDGLLLVTEPQALAGILGQKLECEIVVKIYFLLHGGHLRLCRCPLLLCSKFLDIWRIKGLDIIIFKGQFYD